MAMTSPGSPMALEPAVPMHPSIEVTVNAKGQRQWRVRAYAAGLDRDELEAAAANAVEVDRRLEREYGLPGGGS